MSNMILVTYDLLNKETWRDYKELTDAISKYDNKKVLLSVYILKTTMTASQVREDLSKHIDPNDRMLCSKITYSESDWRIPKDGRERMKA